MLGLYGSVRWVHGNNGGQCQAEETLRKHGGTGEETGKWGNSGETASPLIQPEQRVGESKIHQKVSGPKAQPLEHQQNGLEGSVSVTGGSPV